MARIRTIKPELPQSESIGRLSRDARLLFIQLWTVVDDSGRFRASSRLLASLLYPYDDDAIGLIDGWLEQLERESCIRRYVVSGDSYLEVCNWLKHQKIDKPSKSRIPPPSLDSSNPREDSRTLAPDLVPSTSTSTKTSTEFSSTDTSRYVCEEMGLAGREMMWLAKDCIDLAMKSQKIEAQAAATLIVERWREYDTDDRPFKVGKDKFLKQCMIDPLKWRTENGNGKFSVFS